MWQDDEFPGDVHYYDPDEPQPGDEEGLSILDDPEAVKALNTLRGLGYTPDQVYAMMEELNDVQ